LLNEENLFNQLKKYFNMDYNEQNQEEETQTGSKKGRNKRNRGSLSSDTNQEQGSGDLSTDSFSSESSNQYGSEERGSRSGSSYGLEGDEQFQSEQGEGQEGEGLGEEGDRPRRSGAGKGKIQDLSKRVMKFIDEQTADMDKNTLAKYAAVGVLLLAGMRKSGFLGGLAVSVAAGILTKMVVESASQNNLGEEEEFEAEGSEEEETFANA
jgi:hypothetical protein